MLEHFPVVESDRQLFANHNETFKNMNKLLNLTWFGQPLLQFDLKMKLTSLLFLSVLFGLHANDSYAQKTKVTLNVENASVLEVIDEIEAATRFKFIYKTKHVDLQRLVSLNVEKEKIASVLQDMFNDTNTSYKVRGTQIILGEEKNTSIVEPDKTSIDKVQAQFQVSGTITDNNGAPLPGANVVEKGTTNGVTADFDGNYSIKVSDANATLVVSYLGFATKEIAVDGRSEIGVALEESASGLDEVIVVGYGSQKKANLTGAVASVGSDELVNKAVTGTIDALQGQMPGVTVSRTGGGPGDEDIDIQIRGLTSISSSPVLVIVDGIEGNINDVRPEDVESISVLKDAASAAIYGAKAAGGVILVTTKKGQAGKIKIEYNQYYSMAKLGRTPTRVSSLQSAQLRNEADVNSGGSATVSEEDLAKLADPNFLWDEDPANPNQFRFWGDYDYEDLVFRDLTPMNSHSLAVSGGDEKTTFRLSGTYYDNKGSLKIGPDSNTKYSGRLNLNTKINDYLELATIVSYANNQVKKPFSDINGRNGLLRGVFAWAGTTPIYDPNGNLAQGVRIGRWDSRIGTYGYTYERGIKKRNENNVRLNSTLTIKNLAKGLQFRVVGGIDANFDNIWEHGKTMKRYGIDGTVVGTLPSVNSIKKGQKNNSLKEFQFLVDYNLQLNDHSFTVLGGYSLQDFRHEEFDAQAFALINQDVPSFDWASIENTQLNDAIKTNRFQSVFGRLQYNYKDRYLVEGNLRYDGSSKLNPADQYRLFPSASAAWRISEESWFEVPAVNQFKLRASIGSLGNAGALGNYDYIPLLLAEDDVLLGYNDGEDQQKQYIYQRDLASRNISWETVETTNYGIDLAFFGNKLTASGDYYIKRNKNMLAKVKYPSVIGVNLNEVNAGELKTWGWEANLGWQSGNDTFGYYLNANIGDSQNELVKYDGASVIDPGTTRLLEGRPYNSVWGYKTDGLFQTQAEVDDHAFQASETGPGDVKYLDLNGDGEISTGSQTEEDPGDLVYLGDSSPRYTYGIQGGFNWKAFDFSVFFQGVGERTFLMDNDAIQPFWRAWFGPQAHSLDYWTPENPDAYWPRMYVKADHNFLASDKFIQNGAYIRLKDIQLGFSLPEDLLIGTAITSLRIYVSGRDLWESTKTFDFIDPETRPDSEGREKGNPATFQYPFRRSYTIGLNLSF